MTEVRLLDDPDEDDPDEDPEEDEAEDDPEVDATEDELEVVEVVTPSDPVV